MEGFDDPDVQGVACYISYAKRRLEGNGQFGRGRVRRIGFVRSDGIFDFFDETAVRKPKEVFKRGTGFAFKSRQIVRYYDPKRKAFAYLVYSDKIVQGSPKNSLSAVSCFGSGIPQTDGVQADTSGKLLAYACIISNPIKIPTNADMNLSNHFLVAMPDMEDAFFTIGRLYLQTR